MLQIILEIIKNAIDSLKLHVNFKVKKNVKKYFTGDDSKSRNTHTRNSYILRTYENVSRMNGMMK